MIMPLRMQKLCSTADSPIPTLTHPLIHTFACRRKEGPCQGNACHAMPCQGHAEGMPRPCRGHASRGLGGGLDPLGGVL